MRKPGLPTLDEKLDEALRETFPASDPFALFPEERNAAPLLGAGASEAANRPTIDQSQTPQPSMGESTEQ